MWLDDKQMDIPLSTFRVDNANPINIELTLERRIC